MIDEYKRLKKISMIDGKYFISKDILELNETSNNIEITTKDTFIIIPKTSISRIEYNNELSKIRLVELEKEIDRYKILLDDVLNDYKLDLITKDDFDDFNSSYMYELNNLRLEKEEIEKTKKHSNNLDWLDNFKKNQNFSEINWNIVDEFIKDIYIKENKKIEIKFRYKDQYEELLKYLKNQNSMV